MSKTPMAKNSPLLKKLTPRRNRYEVAEKLMRGVGTAAGVGALGAVAGAVGRGVKTLAPKPKIPKFPKELNVSPEARAQTRQKFRKALDELTKKKK